MSNRQCCVPGCLNSLDTNANLHKFPNPAKDKELFNTWVYSIGGDILQLENEHIFKYRRVCRVHFEQRYCCRNNRLSKEAVPTRNMPEPVTSHLESVDMQPCTQSAVEDIQIKENLGKSVTNMEFNLGFIGGGNMSTAIVKGILKSGVLSASKIWVAGPHIENLKHWSDMGTNVTTENGVVFDNCDMIFLGVKVNKLQNAIHDIKLTTKSTAKEVLFVSMLAGVRLEELHKTIKSNLSGVIASVIRIMPNTPMTVGAGICLYTPDSTVMPAKCTILEKLVSGSALCEKVPEDYMDSLGALTACGPAYMYVVIEALADGAVKQGVPRAMAMRHAAQMVVGSGQMVLQSGKHPGLLKDEVCSPGGSTICGITALENGKLRASLINAVEASTIRNKELGKK